MRYLATHERAVRGRFDFPIQLYYVDQNHPRYEMPFHWHMEYELILVLQGKLHLSLNGENRDLESGDCVLIADGTIHGAIPESCVYECVVFDLERFLPEASICGQHLADKLASGIRFEGCFPAGSCVAELISKLFEAMETERPGYEFVTTGLLWQFFGEILGRKLYCPASAETTREARRTQAIKTALHRIRSDYAAPLTLSDLAQEAGLNPKYFCSIFRQVTGRTPIDYLIYYRVECAAELLCSTQHSITDIALECGFGDISYFSRIFRRFKGQTPVEYRRAHR